jgi:hypothetical protein
MCLRKVCFRRISADFAQISCMVAQERGLSRVMSACGSGLGGLGGSDGPCCSALTQACQCQEFQDSHHSLLHNKVSQPTQGSRVQRFHQQHILVQCMAQSAQLLISQAMLQIQP